ncbi:MAG: hypothetical protein NZO16_05975 [Deltaproteobacteria bacterium]|nr:hypothetical protein [Deltaproteobacteria bacterium]
MLLRMQLRIHQCIICKVLRIIFILVAVCSFSEVDKSPTPESDTEFCPQVITCAKDGRFYPNPCDARKVGGGVAESSIYCEKKGESNK